MNAPEENDAVDALLREQNGYVDDGGFTARVVAALPRRRRYTWLRSTLLLGAAAVGAVLAVRWLPWESLEPVDVSALVSLNFQGLMPWMLVVLVAASIMCAVLAAVESEE